MFSFILPLKCELLLCSVLFQTATLDNESKYYRSFELFPYFITILHLHITFHHILIYIFFITYLITNYI